jgi:predicted dehydrogenase
MDRNSTRRDFLGRSAAGLTVLSAASAAAGESLKPSVSARSAARVLGANDRINFGMIGVGGMGNGHLRAFVKQGDETGDVRVAAVCDVFTKRKERAREGASLTEKDVHHDYRELLARNDVDGVVIASPDHWHAQMAIDAMAAGKDVYLQKPMTLTVAEARKVAEAAVKYHRVLQVGSQHLSDPRHAKARELIAAGEIGELLWAQCTYSRNSKRGEWNYRVDPDGTPETIDWNRWLGSAPKRSFSPERYFRWRKYWDYSGGIATDLFYHKLGPVLYAMGAQFPSRVTGSGGIYVQKDREVPDTYATIIEYPNFYINISASMANAAPGRYFPEVIYGHKGTIVFGRNKVIVAPEPAVAPDPAAESAKAAKEYEALPFNIGRAHTDDFLSCMRSRKQPILNPELGYQLMVAIKLGVDSYREGRVKFWDEAKQSAADKGPHRPAYEGDGRNA